MAGACRSRTSARGPGRMRKARALPPTPAGAPARTRGPIAWGQASARASRSRLERVSRVNARRMRTPEARLAIKSENLARTVKYPHAHAGPRGDGPLEPRRHLKAKICLVGEAAVGKTSLIRRFVQSQFSDDYLTTIGVKVSKKRLDVAIP